MAGTKNDVLVGKNADFSQAGAPNGTSGEANGLITNSQLWIGSTALNAGGTHVNVGTLTSPDGSITIGYSSPNITLQITQSPQFVIRGPNVDFLTVGNTPLFTPSQRFILVGYVLITTALTGVPNLDSASNLGWTAPNYTDITVGIPGAALPTTLDFQAGNFLPTQINNFQVIPASTAIVWRVTSIDTGATAYINRVDLIGYYF